MVKEAESDGSKPRSRRDLASRLLRPHLFFIRPVNTPPDEPGVDQNSAAAIRLRGAVGGTLDVICCGMYRACSTWQYEVIAHLVERHYQGTRLGYLTAAQYAALRKADAAASANPSWVPRVLKSHEGDRVFARSLASGRALAVYSYRDVRDVVYSLAHKRKLTFKQLLSQGMVHQILANDRFWTRCPGVLVQRYEDLLREPAKGVLELARHISLDLDAAEADRIAALYSQESNRARTAALRHRLHQAGIDLDSADNAQICDATTLLHWNHMRDANSCWRSEATREHQAILDRLCGRWLVDHGYEVTSQRRKGRAPGDAPRRMSIQGNGALLVGQFNHLIRTASLRFPIAARGLKRLMRMSTEEPVGATAWGGSEVTTHAARQEAPAGKP